LNCKSCDGGLATEEEEKEQCRGCELKEFAEPYVAIIVSLMNTWPLNGASSREILGQLDEVVNGS